MDLLEVIHTTHACREYRTDAVPDDVLLKVLDAARWAPTESNRQPLKLVVVRDPAKRRALHDLYQPIWHPLLARYASGEVSSGLAPTFLAKVDHFAKHLDEVPVMIVVCVQIDQITAADADLGRVSVSGGSSIYPAVQNLLLAARNEGLGTVLTTLLCRAEPAVKRVLDIPDDVATAAMITLGWPAKPFPRALKRKPLTEMTFLDTWGNALPGA